MFTACHEAAVYQPPALPREWSNVMNASGPSSEPKNCDPPHVWIRRNDVYEKIFMAKVPQKHRDFGHKLMQNNSLGNLTFAIFWLIISSMQTDKKSVRTLLDWVGLSDSSFCVLQAVSTGSVYIESHRCGCFGTAGLYSP